MHVGWLKLLNHCYSLDIFKKKKHDEQPLKIECFHMRQKIKLWVIGTKRREFS